MKQIVPLLLLALVGCGNTVTPAIPPTAGDFVENREGVGTAQVFGIQFRVAANSSGASTKSSTEANFVDAGKSSARKRFAFGDDIAIQLESIDQSEVRFMFNDQDFGNLNVGDKVVIDAEQNVEVNGTARLPK
jgi:hypothetical protein